MDAKWENATPIMRKKNRKGWVGGSANYGEWTEWQIWKGKLVVARFPTRAEAEAELARMMNDPGRQTKEDRGPGTASTEDMVL